MTAAAWSVVALAGVVLASLTSRLNVGILAIALAWIVGTTAADRTTESLVAAFPSSLFLTLVGVTLLFGVAQTNGTIAAVSQRALGLVRGRPALLPAMIFLLACAVSTVGAGAVAATALLAPMAMSLGVAAGGSPLLIALMIGNGANAGNLSPVSAVGVIVQSGMGQAGVGGHAWLAWAANFTAHALAAAVAFLLFRSRMTGRDAAATEPPLLTPIGGRQQLTLLTTLVWVAAVVGWNAPLGLSAFAAAAFLLLAGAGRDREVLTAVPWSVLLMVCGVGVLVALLESSGGMDLFGTFLARVATPGMVNGSLGLITGVISTYSSTSGVVYPAFLPAVPALVARVGGGDPLQAALSINVGAALVDVSPLSTIGALCLAALPPGGDSRKLFRQLLVWGLAMTVVGAIFCQFVVPVITP